MIRSAAANSCQDTTGKADEDIDGFIAEYAKSVYHPVSTCRMGMDAQAVVDTQGRVHGIESLRVVGASVMPLITSSNTNAPTMMIAEKISGQILGKSALAPEQRAFYVDAQWQTRARPGASMR